MQPEIEKIRAIRKANQASLMAKPNVVGVGVGYRGHAGVQTDQLALVVMVSKKVPRAQLSAEELIPGEIDGVPVDVQEVGEVRAQG
ncbi:MAG: hypothetical protein ABIJ39_01500 [Chloroflexota bacterium]